MNSKFRQLRLSHLGRNLEGMRTLPPRPAIGWIASVREALGITLGQIGKKIGSSRQAVQQLEKAEATDRITPGTLRRAAEAMGCELVYALVPKSSPFAELGGRQVREHAARDVKSVVHTMMLEDQKPENADQLIEDEAQRRLNRNKTR